jgi:hypothetical protein
VKSCVFARLETLLCAIALPVLAACTGSDAATSSPAGDVSGPAILTATGSYSLDTQPTTVTLPSLAGSSDTFVATFPAMSSATTLNVSLADGPSSFAIPQAKAIWAPKCPWPLETIGMMFSNSEVLPGTPQIAFTTSRIAGNPTYFDAVLADSTAGTIVAQQQVAVAAGTPAGTGKIPSMAPSWNAVAGHQYVMEIVASTGQFLSCSAIYN